MPESLANPRGPEWATNFTLPKPKERVVRDPASGRHKNAPKFFNYWASVPENKRDLVEVRVYRLWPIVDLKVINPKALIEFDTMKGEIPFEAHSYESAFLHKYGSGEWKCILGEAGIKGKIMECYFCAIDRDNFPPKVDYRTIVHGPFKNEEYIKWLERQPELQGKLPWTVDNQQVEEEQEMNVASAAVESVLRQNEKLTDRVVELQAANNGPGPNSEAEATAQVESVRLVAEGAKAAMDIVTKQAERANNAVSPMNPLDIVDRVLAANRGSADTMQIVQLVMTSQEKAVSAVQEMHRQTLDFMRQRDQETSSTPADDPMDSMLMSMEKAKRFAELFGGTFGRRSASEPAVPAAFAGPSMFDKFLEKLSANPPMLITGLVLMTNLVQSFLGRGRPADQVLAEAGRMAVPGAAAPGAIATPGPQAAPAAAPAPSASDQERQRALQVQQFCELIQPLFIAHFFDEQNIGLDGASFAATMLTLQQTNSGSLTFVPGGPATDLGREQLSSIQGAGREQFDRIIRTYQPIWSLVGGNMPKYTKFLSDMFAYQEDQRVAS